MNYTVEVIDEHTEILTSLDGSIKEIWIDDKFISGSRLRRMK